MELQKPIQKMTVHADSIGLQCDVSSSMIPSMLLAIPRPQWNEPMRLRLPKFIQTKKALPTMLPSGTNPQ